MTTPVDYWYKQGDLQDPLIVTPRDADKRLILFPFGVSVRFDMRDRTTDAIVITNGSAVLIDAIDPLTQAAYHQFGYYWTPADRTAIPTGTYLAEFTVIYPDPDASEQTFPNPDPLVVQVTASVRAG